MKFLRGLSGLGYLHSSRCVFFKTYFFLPDQLSSDFLLVDRAEFTQAHVARKIGSVLFKLVGQAGGEAKKRAPPRCQSKSVRRALRLEIPQTGLVSCDLAI